MMKFVSLLAAIGGITWWSLWFTPDQQGQRHMHRGEFRAAAETFRDPMRQGVAWFRAGEFEKAEQAFARSGTVEAEFNRGNCLVMLGKYQPAIERYKRHFAAISRRVGRYSSVPLLARRHRPRSFHLPAACH